MIAHRVAFVAALMIPGSSARHVMTSGLTAAPPTVPVIAIPALNRRASPNLHRVRVEEQIRSVVDHSPPAGADGDPTARHDELVP